MACFIVPATEAVLTTAAQKLMKKYEKETGKDIHFCFSEKLSSLNKMLWGGSALLAFEHVWHGEVIPYPPFLTAASDPAETAEMIKEMSTSGVAMAVVVTCVWAAVTAVKTLAERRREDINIIKGAEES